METFHTFLDLGVFSNFFFFVAFTLLTFKFVSFLFYGSYIDGYNFMYIT
jgi:hypothetical protein